MKTYLRAVASFVCLIYLAVNARADWSVDIESGLAYNGYNDVRIPGDVGTSISLSEELNSDASAFLRVRLSTELGQRHRLSLLVAPLRLEAAGSVDREVDFNGVRFAAGERLSSRYRFDSYRLSYSYLLAKSDRVRFDLGFTAKIRDAAIKIESETKSAEKTNTGFVPLINFALDWSFASSFGLLFQGDALAAPQGRAEDILIACYTSLSKPVRLRLGYRILEGGADNDEVYNFTLVHYLTAGLTWTF